MLERKKNRRSLREHVKVRKIINCCASICFFLKQQLKYERKEIKMERKHSQTNVQHERDKEYRIASAYRAI